MAKKTIIISEADLVHLLYDKGYMIHETSGKFSAKVVKNIRKKDEVVVSYEYEDKELTEDEEHFL